MPEPIDIPVLSAPRLRAIELLTTSTPLGHDSAALIALAEQDPELTAAVIRAANSAASAPIERVDSARVAIVRIGVSQTREVLLAALMRATFDLSTSGLDQDELWHHLVLTAVLVEGALGRRSNGYTAGLLHDVGRMAMAAQHPGEYRAVVAEVHDGRSALDAERSVFGLSHVEWSVAVARSWGLAEPLVDGIAGHHHLSRRQLPAALYHARGAAFALGYGDGVLTPGVTEHTVESLVAAWNQRLASDPWAAPALRRIGGLPALLRRMGLADSAGVAA